MLVIIKLNYQFNIVYYYSCSS